MSYGMLFYVVRIDKYLYEKAFFLWSWQIGRSFVRAILSGTGNLKSFKGGSL